MTVTDKTQRDGQTHILGLLLGSIPSGLHFASYGYGRMDLTAQSPAIIKIIFRVSVESWTTGAQQPTNSSIIKPALKGV